MTDVPYLTFQVASDVIQLSPKQRQTGSIGPVVAQGHEASIHVVIHGCERVSRVRGKRLRRGSGEQTVSRNVRCDVVYESGILSGNSLKGQREEERALAAAAVSPPAF